MPDITYWYLLIASVLLWIVEMALTAFWWPSFFRSGVTLFKDTGPLHTLELDTDTLNRKFESLTFPSLLFRRKSEYEYFFREAFQFRPLGYAPIIRGRILVEPLENRITVTGRANWLLVLVILLAATGMFILGSRYLDPALLALGLVVLFPLPLGITASVQISRFRKVVPYLSRSSREAPPPSGA